MKIVVVTLAMLLVASVAQAQGPVAPTFRVTWEPRAGSPPTISGTVHNDSPHRVTNVRLRVEGLDGEGRPVGQRLTWAYGSIGPGATTSFVVERVPSAIDYRITVQSFDLVSIGQAP
jgi:hypothetical protein